MDKDKKQRSFSEPIQKENMSSNPDILLKKDKYSSKFELSTKQREEIQEAFSTLDRGTGLIDSNKDLKIALRSLGFEPKKNEIKKLMIDVDKANKDKLDFKDFIEIMSAKLAEKDSKEEIHKAFHLFDREMKGHITFENLKLIAGELGEVLTDEEIQEMINEADMDGDGFVNSEEFFRIMKKTSLY